MAFPTDTFTGDGGDLDVFIPAVWGEKINDFARAKLVMASFFTDRSDELANGGNIVYTPNLTEMSANAKNAATAVTLNSPTETNITLTVSTWKEVSFAIEDREAAQVMHSYAIQERYAKNAGYTIAKDLETAIATLFDGFSQTAGVEGTALTDAAIRSAIEQIAEANVDLEECAFFLHPHVFWGEVQNLDKFSLAVNSPVNDPTAKMPSAHLYGIPVYISTNVQESGTDGYDNALAHPDAIHWATSPLGKGGSKGAVVGSMGVRVQSNYMPDYLSTVTTADILYGVIENRDTFGVKVLSDK